MDATAPTLRPLGVGDIVDRTIGIYRASPQLFLVLAALPYVVLAIASLILNFAFVRSPPLSTLPTDLFDPRAPPPLRTSFPPEQSTGLLQSGLSAGIVGPLVLPG